jgi:cbb3-type cytochrome oxidase subunit 3
MSLTDLMSGAGLSRYAEFALVLFILAFVVIVLRIFAPGRRQEMDRAAQLPLDDGQASTPRSGSDR